MAIIEIKGNKARILDESSHIFLEALDLELSFVIAGSEYSQACQRGRWDGRRRLLSNSLVFPAGLVPRVIDFYKSSNKDISVIDRNKYEPLTPIDISNRLKELNKIPREYQIDAKNEAIKQKRGLIKLPTGSGKTLTAALIIAAVGKKTVFYVVGTDLLYQSHKLFEQIFQREIGFVGDGICNIQDITVASIWTVGIACGIKNKAVDDESTKEREIKEEYYADIKRMVHSSVLNIMDEAHIAAAETMQKISSEMVGEYNIGMSATLKREDKADLLIEAIFGRVIVNITASELIEKGYLVKPVIKFLPVPRPKEHYSNYREVYKYCLVGNDERNALIIRAGMSLVKQGFVTLVLYKEISHGKYLYEQFKENNQHCYLLSGSNTSEVRQAVIKEVQNGDVKLILASSIFDLGIDINNLSGLVLAGGGKSAIRALQRIGRCIRPCPNKDMAAIIDFDDKAKYLSQHSEIRKRIYMGEPGFEIITI